MTRRRAPGRGQAALFGPPARQPVHIWLRGLCVACRVSEVALAAWDWCFCCPGWVEPAPPWALLTADQEPAPVELREAA